MWDRISQVILIVFGALVLLVLGIGLSTSCRTLPSDPIELTLTAIGQTPGGPGGTATFTPPPPPPTATPSPGVTVPVELTPVPGGPSPTPSGPTATPTPPGPSPTPPPAATATPPSSGGGFVPGTTIQHTVIRGEWLLQIGRCYGASYSALVAANWLPNPNLIYPGQIITVPNIGSQGRIIGPPCVQAYIVQAGDTWESLAARFGTTTAILQRANPGALTLGRAIWAPRY